MTSRSIVLGTAAVLLMSAATPLQIGLSPTAAYAQEITLESAMAGKPAEMNAKQLRERIQFLRAAIQDGTLQGADRQAARQKLKAYREVLDGIRAERQEAKQEQQAEQPAEGERTQQQVSEPKAERQAQKDERKAERQAQKEERKAERQAQKDQRKVEQQARKDERKAEQLGQGQQQQAQQQQAQQQQAQQQQAQQQQAQQQQAQQQQAQQDTSGLTPEMTAALRDNRPASELDRVELRSRLQALRAAMQSGALSNDQRRSVQARIQADREVALARREERTDGTTAEQPRQRERRAERDDRPQQEVDRQAREIISDNRPAADLDNQALRQRLNQNRELLGTDRLSGEQTRELRQQLRADREELRARVAARQEEQEEQEEARAPDRDSDDQTRQSPDRSRPIDDRMNDKNLLRIIEDRTPSEQLTERELEQRVRVLSRALKAGNITVRQAEVARLLIGRDREELRDRLHAQRDRRRERRRSGARDNVFVEFEVGYRPPPVIYAAEAMPRDIQMQLVAPPMYQTQRAYSPQEIATNHDVREAMPGIEIDTLNFDFGSAEVRPEEIEKLDEIGMVIESIVAERPDEVFLIEGHTDAVGSDAANDALSQQRALAVVEALLDYFIIDPENLQTVGLGERFLKIQTPEPEEENRRVTVRRITPLLAGRN